MTISAVAAVFDRSAQNPYVMRISLNGESVDTREAKTIAELIDRYQLPSQSILVEHNGFAIHPREWAKRALAEGDHVELIRVVAGG